MAAWSPRFIPNPAPCGQTRREFLWQVGGGFAGLALIDLLCRDGFFAKHAQGSEALNPLAPSPAHFPAKAKHAIFLFMNGAPSHIDTFDHKPALEKYHGKPNHQKDVTVGTNGRPIGHLMKSPFKFQKHGQSGLEISSLYPHTAKWADDLCVIRSMYTDTAAHASGCLQMNTGSPLLGKPCLGSWLTYGLGSENQNLPAFVVMNDAGGGPNGGPLNWTAGYMPAVFQGTLFRNGPVPLLDLATPEGTSDRTQRRVLDLLGELNREHRRNRPGDSELAARIQSYELAYRMQTSASEAVDLEQEPEHVKSLYGLDNKATADFGRRCLIARRLIERGVRFVQLYSAGGADSWDGHNDVISNHTKHAGETDQPIAALIADLKRTGLWDETLLIWGGEFGRTPTSEGLGKTGRDHNWYGFCMWLAGAGVKGGQYVGSTDELGWRAADDPVHVSDFHATILHLMGLNHEHLTYFYQGLEQKLTGVEKRHVVHKVLA